MKKKTFFWMDVFNAEKNTTDSFEILLFAHEAKDFSAKAMEDALKVGAILEKIKIYQTMAFMKNSDLFSIDISNAFQENKMLGQVSFKLKDFSANGSLRYERSLFLVNVGVLDFKGRIRLPHTGGVDIVEITCDGVNE